LKHQDIVDLLRGGILLPGGRWADLGSGEGAFTLALRELLGPDAEIISIDKDRSSLEEQKERFRNKFPNSNVQLMRADFTHSLNLAFLDGIVMANALHFFRDKERILRDLSGYLKPNGKFILVEYNVSSGNMWVPYPISFESFRALAPRAGLSEPRLLATKPSRFLRGFYSAETSRRDPSTLLRTPQNAPTPTGSAQDASRFQRVP
jgi:ubiquinone/menaquinone biosynthesis C-methylase UbiE